VVAAVAVVVCGVASVLMVVILSPRLLDAL
jgi:hypothetical protein